MSIQAVAWALEQDLPARPKLVLVSISNHASHTDGYCWLNAETIAGEAACTSRSVYKYVGALVRNGYVRKAARKGDDGKQRANDYWLLLAREPAKWDWGAGLVDGEQDPDPETNGDVEDGSEPLVPPAAADSATAPISCEPHAPFSYGESGQKPPESGPEKHEFSHGPTESAFSRKSLDEPSNTKPKESLRRDFSAPPRGYRPPPIPEPPPLGALVNQAKQIFVYEGTRAWEAWKAHRNRETGQPGWPTTTAFIEGKSHTGWWFPTLFPPKAPEPAPESLATEEELQEFANTS